MVDMYTNKKILVTGGAGTVGQELVKQLIDLEPKEIVVLDNNESGLFELLEQYNGKIKGFVGNIANRDLVMRTVEGCDILFHLAAMKHVILGETSPDNVVETNILGLQNVLDACAIHNVERFVFTSSDKAVNPTNVMGTSKLMGERLVTAAHGKRKNNTIYCSTRFGNVIGSRGSVFHIFKRQIEKGGPLTLTDKEMTRFVMTIEESAKLILHAGEIARGGEVFVTKMPIIKIEDLAKAMRDLLAKEPEKIEITEIGAKPGEKMYEELMSDEETRRSYELDRIFAVLPAFTDFHKGTDYSHAKSGKKVDRPYNSSLQIPLSLKEVKEFLTKSDLLEE